MNKLIFLFLLLVLSVPVPASAQDGAQAPCPGATAGFAEKPELCPCCGSIKIDDAEVSLEDRAVIQGVALFGVEVPDDDIPKWKCQDCGAAFYKSVAPATAEEAVNRPGPE